MTDNADATIIRRIQAGEPELFSGLYERYIDEVFRFTHWRIRHRETAEDITSQVFMKALKNIHQLKVFDGARPTLKKDNDSVFAKGKSSLSVGFRPWLYRIARNAITDHWRAKRDHVDISEVEIAATDDIAGTADMRSKLKEVEKYLAGLDEVQRDIVVLRVWEGLSYREISEIVGKSEDNCKVIFSRVAGKMRTELIVALLIFKYLWM